MFQFRCPTGHLLQGKESDAGQKVNCPTCGLLFTIPPPPATVQAQQSAPQPPPTPSQLPPKSQDPFGEFDALLSAAKAAKRGEDQSAWVSFRNSTAFPVVIFAGVCLLGVMAITVRIVWESTPSSQIAESEETQPEPQIEVVQPAAINEHTRGTLALTLVGWVAIFGFLAVWGWENRKLMRAALRKREEIEARRTLVLAKLEEKVSIRPPPTR